MKRLLFLIFALLIFSIPKTSQAQTQDVKDVQATIEQLFDGMRESDSSKVADTFTADAIMKTIARSPNGDPVLNNGNLAAFLRAVGTDKEQIWDERIGGYDINIDGALATVWTPYQFYIGEEFSHCGVNSFQLIKKGESWKIFFIVDTRRGENCVES